jgi:hypothetical protein
MRPIKRHAIAGHDQDLIVRWRTGQLREAGFDLQLAEALARDCAYDLHAVLRLVDNGCPPELAARILAPLDPEQQPC